MTTPTTRLDVRTQHSALYYIHDGNKNVCEVVAANCECEGRYDYAPFGAISLLHGEAVVANQWRFTSEYADDELVEIKDSGIRHIWFMALKE